MATQFSLLDEPLLSLIPRVVFLFACPSVQIPWVGGGSLFVSSEGWEGVGGWQLARSTLCKSKLDLSPGSFMGLGWGILPLEREWWSSQLTLPYWFAHGFRDYPYFDFICKEMCIIKWFLIYFSVLKIELKKVFIMWILKIHRNMFSKTVEVVACTIPKTIHLNSSWSLQVILCEES